MFDMVYFALMRIEKGVGAGTMDVVNSDYYNHVLVIQNSKRYPDAIQSWKYSV